MAQLNPSEAAFEGFRFIRREPVTLLIWGAVAVALQLLMFGLMRGTGYLDALTQLTANAQAGPAAGAQLMRAMGPMMGFGFGAMLVSIVFYAVLVCAVYRGVLRPGESGLGRLRLGGDEGRMIGLFLIMMLLWIAAFVVFIIAGIVLGAVFGLSAARSGQDSGAGVAGIVGMVMLMYLGFFVFAAWFCVQFSMAAPMTFAERRLAVFRSWKLVRGNFWRLLGCFVLTFIFTLLVAMAVGVVQMFLFTAVGVPTAFSSLAHPGVAPDMTKFFTPGALVANAVIAMLGAVFYPIWFAPQAAAYRDIVGFTGDKAAEVFG